MITIKENLKEFILFQNLTTEEIAKIEKIVYQKSYDKDQIIFLEGTEADAIYIIIAGLIKIFKTDESGREKTLALLGAGDFFGEMALFDDNLRSASVEAIQDSKLFAIEKSRFNNLITEFPDIALKIIVVLSKRLREANKQINDLTFKKVSERLEEVLSDLVKEYGIKKEEGLLISKKITHQELANLVGTTRETITKLLGELAEEDKLLIKDRYLIVTDPQFIKDS